MPRFKILVSIIILVAALFLIFDKLFTPQPIQITLESGQQITTSTTEYFSIPVMLLLITCAFLIGSTSIYLFYNSDRSRPASHQQAPAEPAPHVYDIILPLLKPDEKKVVEALRESGGEMQQNKLVLKLGISKVKATRILYGLEHKNLIGKERHGLTNMVRLKK
jgi:hypothetical protein